MSMSTHIIGFAPPDETWLKMKAIWDACEAAQLDPPEEVGEFFGYTDPDPAGVEVEIPYSDWANRSREGFEVALKDIPKHVKTIRFYNSW